MDKQLVIAITSKDKMGFLTRESVQPDKTEDHVNHAKWITGNVMVHSWILNGLSPSLSASFVYTENAAKLWQTLKESVTM